MGASHDSHDIMAQAAHWFACNRGAMSSERRAEFAAWLRISPRHIEEYLLTASLAGDLAAAARDDAVDESLLAAARSEIQSDTVIPLHRAAGLNGRRGSRMPRRRWAVAAALIAATAVSLTFWAGSAQRFATGHGEQHSWRLSDGSVLSLNSDSAVTLRYGDRERLVDLDRGQALFQVAHDVRRPFRVSAGTVDVIAVGTEFEVYRRDRATLVTVVEGKVTASLRKSAASSIAVRSWPVAAGQQIRLDAREPRFTPEPVDTHRAVAWMQKQIIFDHRPLGEVVDEFNRYGSVPISIEGDELRQVSVSGVFNAYDTESFIAFLRRLQGVQVTETPKVIRVISGPQA